MLESLTNLSAVGQSYRVTALSLVPNGTFTSELMKLKSVTAKRGEISSYYSYIYMHAFMLQVATIKQCGLKVHTKLNTTEVWGSDIAGKCCVCSHNCLNSYCWELTLTVSKATAKTLSRKQRRKARGHRHSNL